jgi:hypothetical protein
VFPVRAALNFVDGRAQFACSAPSARTAAHTSASGSLRLIPCHFLLLRMRGKLVKACRSSCHNAMGRHAHVDANSFAQIATCRVIGGRNATHGSRADGRACPDRIAVIGCSNAASKCCSVWAGVSPVKVVHHLHLVIVAEATGDFGPRTLGEQAIALERGFEPLDARERLSTDAHLLHEPALLGHKLSH